MQAGTEQQARAIEEVGKALMHMQALTDETTAHAQENASVASETKPGMSTISPTPSEIIANTVPARRVEKLP